MRWVSPEPGRLDVEDRDRAAVEGVERDVPGGLDQHLPPVVEQARDEGEGGGLGERLAAGDEHAAAGMARDLAPRRRRPSGASPSWNAYAVSHHAQRSGQPVRRTNTQGCPARVPSPWIEKKVSLTVSVDGDGRAHGR